MNECDCVSCERAKAQRAKKTERIHHRIRELTNQLKQLCDAFGHDFETQSSERRELVGHRTEYDIVSTCPEEVCFHRCRFPNNCPTEKRPRSVGVYQTITTMISTCTCCGETKTETKRRAS